MIICGTDCKRGFAFVVEGETERVFYQEYLQWCCAQSQAYTMRGLPQNGWLMVPEAGENAAFVTFNVMGSIGSVPNAMSWIKSLRRNYLSLDWSIALCYDTDGGDPSNLNTRSWHRFRADLAALGLPLIDLAANADIEDIMLADIEGVRKFIGVPEGASPRGRKGKAKINSLFKAVDVTRPYHEGEKARPLIQALSFDVIERKAPISLCTLRSAVFSDQ